MSSTSLMLPFDLVAQVAPPSVLVIITLSVFRKLSPPAMPCSASTKSTSHRGSDPWGRGTSCQVAPPLVVRTMLSPTPQPLFASLNFTSYIQLPPGNIWTCQVAPPSVVPLALFPLTAQPRLWSTK